MSAILLLIVVFAVGNIEASETCAKKLDLVLAVDGSSSICDDSTEPCLKWYEYLQFCKDIVNSLIIGPEDSNVAFATISNFTEVKWNLREHRDRTSLLSAIDNVQYPGGELIDVVTISRYITKVFNPVIGDRAGVQNIGIVISDGAPNFPDSIYALESDLVQLRGVGVFVVCVTPGCNDTFAKGISSYPKEVNETYFFVDKHLSIDLIRDLLVKKFCTYEYPVNKILNTVK